MYHNLGFSLPIDEFKIIKFDLKKADDSLLEKYLDWKEVMNKIRNPDEPAKDRKTLLELLQNRDPNYTFYSWVILSKEHDIVVGYSTVWLNAKQHPKYDELKHLAFCKITILPKFRQQGLGTLQLETCIAEIKKHKDITIIQASARDASGKQFCEKYGGSLALEGFDNRLYIKDVNWDLVNGWVMQGKVLEKGEGVSLETFEELPDEFVEDYCSVLNNAGREERQSDLEGQIEATPDSYRKSMQRLKVQGLRNLISITIESTGRISGLTTISIRKESPTVINQGMTGVKGEFCGRGLGKWLKADMLLKIRERYPEVTHIRTGNANNNAPMLSINNRLGFMAYEHVSAYKFKLEDLLHQFNIQ